MNRWNTPAKQIQAEIDFLITIVCEHFGISDRALISHCRSPQIVVARHVLRHIMRSELGMRVTEVAKVFGMDHSAMVHSSNRIKVMLYLDAELRELMIQFIARLKEFQRQQQEPRIFTEKESSNG